MVLDCIKFIKYSIDLQNNSTFVRVVPENNKESGRFYKSHPPVSENGSGSIFPIGLEFPAESQRKYPVFDFFQVAAFLRDFLFERIGRDVVQREVVAGVDYQSVVEGIGEADGNGDVGRPFSSLRSAVSHGPSLLRTRSLEPMRNPGWMPAFRASPLVT